jgi:large subunit ribosomal protein L18
MLRKIKNKSSAIFLRRRDRVRFKLKKTRSKKCRLSVFVSNSHIYVQAIDDLNSLTLASASTLDKELKPLFSKTSNIEAAKVVGKHIALRLLKLGVSEVVFDRGGNLYHGKIKSLADSARENGLKF